jgi:hypothetical protein
MSHRINLRIASLPYLKKDGLVGGDPTGNGLIDLGRKSRRKPGEPSIGERLQAAYEAAVAKKKKR